MRQTLVAILSLCPSFIALGQEYSEAYFRDPQRIESIRQNQPSFMECQLMAKNRAGKAHSVATTQVDLDYNTNVEPHVDIKQPSAGASWGAWFAHTVFPLRKNSNRNIKLRVEAVRKDVSNTRETEHYVEQGVLVNEAVVLTFETTLDHVAHFRRTGIEEMADWKWQEVVREVAGLDSVNATLKIESKEARHSVGRTPTQTIYQKWRRFWYNADQGFETFLDPVADDYVFMAPSPDKQGKLVEISELNLRCTWDAKNIEI